MKPFRTAVILLPVWVLTVSVLAPPLNHDVAAVLQFSQRWLAGERLYVDLIDVNPPLIFVLNVLPAWLVDRLGMGPAWAIRLCVALLGLVSWRLSWIARDRAHEAPGERRLVDMLPGLVLVLAGYDFGQREHLMAIAILPYLLGAVGRAEGRRVRGHVEAAALAAVFLALKPHFLAIPALVEAMVLLSGPRSWRARLTDAVPWTMAAIWSLYGIVLVAVVPLYLTAILPLVRDLYLPLGDLSLTDVLLIPRLGVVELLLFPVLALGRGRLTRVIALAACGALAAALVQHKGWTYHVLPVALFTLSAAAILAARTLPASVLAGLMALFMTANAEAPWKELDFAASDTAILTRELRRCADGGRVLALSSLISPIFPALNDAHATLASRTMTTWLIQGAYAACQDGGRFYRSPAQMGPAESFAYRTTIADFARIRPQAVLVDSQAGIPDCGAPFDYLAYFRRDTLFATTWAQYHEVAAWGRFSLYARQPRRE